MTGTVEADLIYAYNGNDIVYGGSGGDYINGGRGNDTLYGEDGDDIFEIGGSGSDIGLSPAGGLTNGWDHFHGGSGYDTIRILPTSGYSWTAIQISSMTGIEAIENSTSGPGYVYFSGAIDFSGIEVLGNITSVFGGSGTDTFNGGSLDEVVEGNGGSDFLYGNGGNDILYGDSSINPSPAGAAGVDYLYGGTGNDQLHGGDGNDFLYGGEDDDVLYGDAGNDFLDVGAGNNDAWGGAGADVFYFNTGTSTNIVKDFSAAQGDKIVISTDIADDFSDLTIVNTPVVSAVTVGGLTIYTVGSGTLTASDFEFYNPVFGTAGNDVLEGSYGVDRIYGGGGNDQLNGGAGNDRLYGEAGNDILNAGSGSNEAWGGTGADVFFFNEGGTTIIRDFSIAENDKIRISSAYADSFSDLNIFKAGNVASQITVSDLTITVIGSQTLTASQFEFV